MCIIILLEVWVVPVPTFDEHTEHYYLIGLFKHHKFCAVAAAFSNRLNLIIILRSNDAIEERKQDFIQSKAGWAARHVCIPKGRPLLHCPTVNRYSIKLRAIMATIAGRFRMPNDLPHVSHFDC